MSWHASATAAKSELLAREGFDALGLVGTGVRQARIVYSQAHTAQHGATNCSKCLTLKGAQFAHVKRHPISCHCNQHIPAYQP
jgi:hypothetical protein